MTLVPIAVTLAAIHAGTAGAAAAAAQQCPRAEVVEVMAMASAETRPVTYQNGTIHVRRSALATLSDVVQVGFNGPEAITLTFTPEVGERMERVTGSKPNFPMAFAVFNDAVVSVVLQGGFGIGKNGLQISTDRNFEQIKTNSAAVWLSEVGSNA